MAVESLIQCCNEVSRIATTVGNDIHSKDVLSHDFSTGAMKHFPLPDSGLECAVWDGLSTFLKDILKPVLYWFEILSNHNGPEIVSAIRNAKAAKAADRMFPAIRKDSGENKSNCLYVGCCTKTSLFNRVFWHTGYYRVGGTQGLQLCHWAIELDLKLRLSVLSMPVSASRLIYVLESALADHLRPIIGRHG